MKFYQKILLTIMICALIGGATEVLAQESRDYVPLAPIEGVIEEGADLESYVPGVVRLMIGLAALAAVFMIVLGGFTYMSTDAIGKKDSGRHMITRALWGLALALAAYLILSTINPNILNFNLTLGKVGSPAGPGGSSLTPGTFGSPFNPPGLTETEAREALGGGIDFNNDGCTSVGQTGCTSVAGLPQNAINDLVDLQSGCGCSLTVTGGTEYWLHNTHGPGLAVVDLRPTSGLNNYLGIANPQDGQTVTIDGNTYTFESAGGNSSGTSTGDHWHVVFN